MQSVCPDEQVDHGSLPTDRAAQGLVRARGRRRLVRPAGTGGLRDGALLMWLHRAGLGQLVTSLVTKWAQATPRSTTMYAPWTSTPRSTSCHRIGSRNRSTQDSQ